MVDTNEKAWRKSQRSNSQGACVEVGQDPAVILVRDTKNRGDAQLKVTPGAWMGFLASVKE